MRAPGTAYNGVAPLYDRLYSRPRDRAENAVLRALAYDLGFHRGRVLDLACGTGLLLDLLMPEPRGIMAPPLEPEPAPYRLPHHGYLGVDASAAMLQEAARKHGKRPGVRFLSADMTAPTLYTRLGPGLDDGWTHLWCTFALELLTEPQVVAMFRAWRDLLGPGGRVLVTAATARHLGDQRPGSRIQVDGPPMLPWDPGRLATVAGIMGEPRVRGLGYTRTGRPWLAALEFGTLGRLWPDGADFLVVDLVVR